MHHFTIAYQLVSCTGWFAPGRVVVLGGGTAGVNAARVAAGIGADVTILEGDFERMRFLDNTMSGASMVFSSEANLSELLPRVDLLIGAVLLPGAKAPQLITREMLRMMASAIEDHQLAVANYFMLDAAVALEVYSTGEEVLKNGDGEEWLELGFETPVAASEIHIHAGFNPGAVVRVLGAPEGGEWTELWAGEGSPDAMQTLAVSPARELQRLRLELDTGKVPGWNEIDAVALIDSDGSRHWATAAKCSSVWSQ